MAKKLMVFLILFVALQVPVVAESGGSVVFSEESISVNSGSGYYDIDIIISEQEQYSSAEFGLILSEGITLESATLNAGVEGTKVGIKEKEGIHYFGFINSQNKYSGELNVFTIRINTNGQTGSVAFNEAYVVHLTEKGGAKKQNLLATSTVQLTKSNNTGNSSSSSKKNDGTDVIIDEATPLAGIDSDGMAFDTITLKPEVVGDIGVVTIDYDTVATLIEAGKDNAYYLNIALDLEGLGTLEGYRIHIPAKLFRQGYDQKYIRLTTPLSSVFIPFNTLNISDITETEIVTLNINQITTETLTEYLTAQQISLGGVHVYLELDAVDYLWMNKDEPIKVYIPIVSTTTSTKTYEQVIVAVEDNKEQSLLFNALDNGDGTIRATVNKLGRFIILDKRKTFADINDSWAQSDIEMLAIRNIINGTSATTYGPSESITRADFVKLLMGVLDQSGIEGEAFVDVTTTDYYYDSVTTAKSLGIINGNANNAFEPLKPITREDMMTMVARSLELMGEDLEEQADMTRFTDYTQIADYAQESVNKLVTKGIIQGSNGQIYPKDNLTRAEAAHIIYMILLELY